MGRRSAWSALLVGLALLVSTLAPAGAGAADSRPAPPVPNPSWIGPAQQVGNGTIRAFVDRRGAVPNQVGVRFTEGLLQGLPMHPPTDGQHCYDVDGDGVIDQHTECVGGYEYRLALPSQPSNEPYQWVMFNWNPHGHSGAVYPKPHFDFHFYIVPEEEVEQIRMGPCAELINCDDYETALLPLAPEHLPAGYLEIEGAAEGKMGNHMIDPTVPVGQDFTRVFIYGKYDAKITFLEPMITRDYFLSMRTSTGPRVTQRCEPIAQPQRWQERGWYPRTSCVSYDRITRSYDVTLTDFYRG